MKIKSLSMKAIIFITDRLKTEKNNHRSKLPQQHKLMEFFSTHIFNFGTDVGRQSLTPSLTMPIWLLKETNIFRLKASYWK